MERIQYYHKGIFRLSINSNLMTVSFRRKFRPSSSLGSFISLYVKQHVSNAMDSGVPFSFRADIMKQHYRYLNITECRFGRALSSEDPPNFEVQ